jgi:hypothetical protein
MKNLEERQREMRERTAQGGTSKPERAKKSASEIPATSSENSSAEIGAMQKRIVQLEADNERLEAENERLRRQKTIVVERAQEKSCDEQVREQRHNYFKYSNARRW